MAGRKRLAVCELGHEVNDSDGRMFQSKRAMSGSAFNFQTTERMQQSPIAKNPLDVKRAASSQQLVRALNNQFASWVQSQLQNHIDELWEDGVKDYLSHASSIMDKYQDVVEWLREESSTAKNSASEKKPVFETSRKDPSYSQETQHSPYGLFTNFQTSYSTGLLSNSQPLLFGSQNSHQANHMASEDAEDDDGIEQPSSPSVKKTEEEGIKVVHEVKCKLYVKSTDPSEGGAWKDMGTGNLIVKCREGVDRGMKEAKPTIIMRNDVGRVLLNASIYPGIKTSLQKNSLIVVLHITKNEGNDGCRGDVVARTFLIRVKKDDERDKLASIIEDHAPSL